MRRYEPLITGSRNGGVITQGLAKYSFLVLQCLDGGVPKCGLKRALEQIQIIINGVNADTINN